VANDRYRLQTVGFDVLLFLNFAYRLSDVLLTVSRKRPGERRHGSTDILVELC
jgi:hypothetical protein